MNYDPKNMKCPYCKRNLLENTKLVYETLSDHVLDPNGTPPERMSYTCQCSPGVFYGEDGDVYVTSRDVVENWFKKIYFRGFRWHFSWLLSSRERYLLKSNTVSLSDLPSAVNSLQENVDKDMRFRKSLLGKVCHCLLYKCIMAPYWHFRRKKFGL